MSFDQRFDWQDGFMPLIRQIVGYYTAVPGSQWEDVRENTDLRVLKASGLTISCRLRKYRAYQYRGEFTIRMRSQFGGQTEFEKVKRGFGDWMFYGIANKGDSADSGIICWSLIDLTSFRYHMMEYQNEVLWKFKENEDGTAFGAFRYEEFRHDPSLLIASYNLDGGSERPVLGWVPDHPDIR